MADEWQCPLCGQRASEPAGHMREAHLGARSTEDRLGLRRALGRRPSRPARRRAPRVPNEPPPPPLTIEVPAEGALLRMVCPTPLERDALDLRLQLTDLPGVRSAAIDLASGLVDLEIGPEVPIPQHVLQLATARCKLPVMAAELHARPQQGQSLGAETLLAVLR